MKIGRRSFLSFLIGGAAGTTLSPLPWKLTDDLSIWTQNWPWTPVPEDGEVSYVHSTCSLCPGGCGISVRKVEDRAVKIEGVEGHPLNNGGACILGLSGLQMLYGPTRVKTPLKRTGERGEGKWAEISWDEAISEIGQRLGEIRTAGQSHTLACISGSDRGTVAQMFSRFLKVYGSPNFIATPSFQDAYELTIYLMHGVQGSAGFDFENADFILSFGTGIIDGWGSPVRMFKANSTWKEKDARVVQVEPRLSNTAAKSDLWIPIKPGTEGALALGIAHVMIKENLYDGFAENFGFGFDDWTDDQGNSRKGFKRLVLEDYGPDAVSKITGIDIKTIWELARSFAKADKPLAICGRGRGATPGATYEFMAVHALNALAGNINKAGGFWAMSKPNYIFWPGVAMDQAASSGMKKERLDSAGSEKYPYTRYCINQFIENVVSGKGYPVKALLVSGANPLYSLPNSSAVKDALAKIPFVVSFSSYMDETAQNADLILPNHCYLERYEDVPSPAGFHKPFVGLCRPVVEPQFNTKHTGDVIIALASAMGGNIADAFNWESYEACLEETMGNKWEAMKENGYWMEENYSPRPLYYAFETDTRKFEFAPKAIATRTDEDIDALPHFEPVAVDGDEANYPLLLVPYDSLRLSGGYIGTPPFMVKTVEDTVLKDKDILVEINPKTAQAQGLSEGKRAVLSTPKGKATVRVHLFEGLMPGLVAMSRGLGHSAYDDYLAGKGVNCNELVGPVTDPVSGLDAAYGIRAKLTKA